MRNRMKLPSIIIACIALAFAISRAQETNKAGTTAAQFLKIGVGARAMGMGGAMVGIANDASAMYWNPSGLLQVPSLAVFATHSRWFADIKHEYFGLVLPVAANHRIGISATVLTMGDMEITTEEQPHGTGNFFSASDVAVGVSYAIRLVDFFSFGTTIKYINQSIYNETATGVAVDFGTMLRTGYRGIKIGMAFTNFGTTMKLEGRDLHRTYDPNPNNAVNVGVSSYLGTESWELPINFRVGIGWDIIGADDAMFTSETNSLKLALDANHPNDAPEHANLGIEYMWQNLLAVRFGYRYNQDVQKLSGGAGLNWNVSDSFGIGLDYAFAGFGHLGSVQIISLTVSF